MADFAAHVEDPHETNLTEEQYHASSAVSRSNLFLAAADPALYLGRHIEREYPEASSTAAKRLGSALHRLVSNKGDVVVRPLFGKKKVEQEAKREWEREHADAVILTESESWRASQMLVALKRHPDARGLLFGANVRHEVTFGWQERGHECRCMIDALKLGGRPVLSDLKTAHDIRPHRWDREAFDYGYHLQPPWYSRPVAAIHGDVMFAYVVVQSSPPFGVIVRYPDTSVWQLGESMVQRGLRQLEAPHDRELWTPDWQKRPMPLTVPRYLEHLIDTEIDTDE